MERGEKELVCCGRVIGKILLRGAIVKTKQYKCVSVNMQNYAVYLPLELSYTVNLLYIS